MAGTSVVRQLDVVQGFLHKSVIALAIIPTNRSITVTARKAYSVMLYLAQQQVAEGTAGEGGAYTAPLGAILKGFGATSSITSQAKKYIDQMVSTRVEWRPLAKSEDQLALWFEDAREEGGAGEGAPTTPRAVPQELRIFNLLAEVRIFLRAGQVWISWFYPPSIHDELVNPTRWAQVDFEVLRQLTTYASVSLYEICARYRDNPGGVTTRHHWSWWAEALRGSPTSKPRAWRKFKSEFLAPAIKEINSLHDIKIELIEFRRGREIDQVQFVVSKSETSRRPLRPPTAVDLTNIVRGNSLGLSDASIEQLELEFGAHAVSEGLARFEKKMAGTPSKSIPYPAKYLKAIITNVDRESSASQQAPPRRDPLPQRPAIMQHITDVLPAVLPGVDGGRDQAFSLMKARFASLPVETQMEWVANCHRHAVESNKVIGPNMMKRLNLGEWRSPLVELMVIGYYAEHEFGPDWRSRSSEEVAEPPTH